MLKFSSKNAKLERINEWTDKKQTIYSFSLPSGYTCPGALDCRSFANKNTGKIIDGKDTKYRCFSASTESMFPSVRNQRWDNFEPLKKLDATDMVKAIREDLPKDMNILRVHVGGDFFHQRYFDAWLAVARLNPTKTFYAYTKSIHMWVARIKTIPGNFKLNASRGGKYDNLIDEYKLKEAVVVFSLEEAEAKNLEIDHNEKHAIQNTGSFALLIHGTQPKGSEASEALKSLKKQGINSGYSRKESVSV